MYHTSTRIYHSSLDLVALVRRACAQLPPGHAFLADQLRRAAASVTLNYAEGCGKRSLLDRRRFFATAKGSCYEVAAALGVAHALGALPGELAVQGRSLCDGLAAMLHRYR